MTILIFILGLVIGIVGGVMCTTLVAANRINEINSTWYDIANRISDGEKVDLNGEEEEEADE